MSDDLVQKAFADMLTLHVEQNGKVDKLGSAVGGLVSNVDRLAFAVRELQSNARELRSDVDDLADGGKRQEALLRDIIKTMKAKADNSVDVRKEIANIKHDIQLLKETKQDKAS